MTGDGGTHNEFSGSADNNAQIGINYGPVSLHSSSDSPKAGDAQAARNALADAVRAGSARELRTWGLRDQEALPVRWGAADDDLFAPWKQIQRDGRPKPLRGQFTEIRETYEAVDSKRLVILGRAGSGKTVLAHRLILDLLKHNPTGPVPVLFGLGDWNPGADLPDWLAEHLVRDFPFLDAKDAVTGRKHAEAFVENGLVLPVLDGFDEIPEDHQPGAIARISSLDLPLVVTSRTREYARAAHEIRAVGGAAAIALENLTLGESSEYLGESTGKVRAPAWDSVFEHLRTAPGETASRNLAPVLTSPLMVTLARTVYNDDRGRDPGELLDTERFPTTPALEDNLLADYLKTVYAPRGARRPNWNPDQARRWLGHLATHLRKRGTHDLSWWQLPATLHRRTRIFVTTAVLGLTYWLATGPLDVLSGTLPESVSVFMDALDSGLVDAVTGGIMIALTNGLAAAIAAALIAALAVGLAVGLAVALINEAVLSRAAGGREPERIRLGRKRPGREPRPRSTDFKNLAFEFAGGLVLGLVLGLLFGLSFGLAFGLAFGVGIVIGISLTLVLGLVLGLALGLAFGLSYGLVNGAVSMLGDTYDPRATAPWTLLIRDRAVTLVRIAMASSLGGWLTTVIANGLMGTDFDSFAVIMLGLVAGMARLTLSAWGSWLLFARLWLPLTGRLPWRPKRFLEDAYERGVLRSAGAVYQFRHARLRDHLAERYRG